MKNKLGILLTLTFLLSLGSCFQDLDLAPPYGVNSASVYEDPANYINVLAKLYAGLSLSGNNGPAGEPDIVGIDEGFSSYIRVFWNLQEVPTDEAVVGWNDPGLPELNTMEWVATNSWTGAMYYRIFFQITLINEFIRESDADKLNGRGFSQADVDRISQYQAEARFLRALSYFHALDLYGGNVPFVTEEDLVGAFLPEQTNANDLFAYIESELLDLEAGLMDPVVGYDDQVYARANKAAAWTLLAKLYLNAEVYTGSARWNDCITYCQKVIDAGYELEGDYTHLFLADNQQSREIIFPVTFHGLNSKTYGGTTFLTHAPVGGSMSADDFGINTGWGGYRTTKGLVNTFTDTLDNRYLFYTDGQNLEVNSIGTFTDGYAVAKWRNVDRNGNDGVDPTGDFVDIDYPMFRLAEVYLMYAEAAVRSGGDTGKGAGYLNELRDRAGIDDIGNDYTAMDVLDERARELYWEAQRRTDLIRYGRYTGGAYLWPWKGGVMEGTSVSDHLGIYPLPESDLSANPNLDQNPQY
ncbi:MAG: RagB/SusD family nutrient uptake outer membrane protein [Saprospiraceae bacterium]|nr:RagB/SusD family nutrient uptake outer membrane protein [Saprospiraceae bacterium]MCB0623006.1 RagB/SusD family nutrient uptake outer membrane protein [Saprospiraceae bacterium]MCB0682149.1 RagB/SusD family nutrient uptake outer membrane protein [Saprospiraceae bacterium]